jgi:hypothetical protein
MPVARCTPDDYKDGMVVVEMTLGWLDADGLHLVECPLG